MGQRSKTKRQAMPGRRWGGWRGGFESINWSWARQKGRRQIGKEQQNSGRQWEPIQGPGLLVG